MTTGPLAVKSDSLTGLPSTPFSAKSGAFCPTSSALALPARATLIRTATTTLRSSSDVRMGPPRGWMSCLTNPAEGLPVPPNRPRARHSSRRSKCHVLASTNVPLRAPAQPAPAIRGEASEGGAEPPPSLLALEPVAQRLDGGAGLDEAVPDGGHDLLRPRGVAVDADGVHLGRDGLAGDGRHLLLHGHPHGLVRRLRRIADQGVLAELARDELAVIPVDAVGESLGGHPGLGLARLRVVLGHGHDHEDQAGVELGHLLGRGAAELQILFEHVVLDAVGLDVLEGRAGGLDEGPERAHLVAMDVLDFLRAYLHVAPAEAHEVGQAGVRADGHAVREGQLHGLAHHVRVAAVEAAGDVGRRDVRHDVLVAPQDPAAVALSHVAVDVDVDAHSFAMTSLAIRSTCAGW